MYDSGLIAAEMMSQATNSSSSYIKGAIYLSYTALSDFKNCPRAYYLKNVYRTNDGLKLQIASPSLTLGATVHDAIKWFLLERNRPSEEELLAKFRNLWRKFRLERGGFANVEDEIVFGQRGLKMLQNFYKNCQCLGRMAPAIEFPKINLVENVVLFGNFDYVEEMSDGTLHIVDFKTGIHDQEDTTQLHMYAILAEEVFGKKVSKVSFWYLDRDDNPKEAVLDELLPKMEYFKTRGAEVKEAITKKVWICVKNPGRCKDCREYQLVLDGKAKYMYDDWYFKKKIYYLDRSVVEIIPEE